MYKVNFGTGAGDESGFKTIEEAQKYADENCSYTQSGISIEDEDGDVVSRRPWWGCESGIEESSDPISFGSFGFLGDWE